MHSIPLGVVAGLLSVAALTHAAKPPPSSANQQRIGAGRLIYQQYCASCHGAKGEGKPGWQQRDAQGELPPPPHGPEGHTWKHADGMLYRIIRDGWRDPFNKTKRQTMPAYGQTLAPGEIRAVITYLKTLWTPEQRRIQREESRRQPFPPEAQ
ncbi:MAG: cytochrome c, class I [Burkholderiales bacterium RIFCSPLOWO2_02_FULL_57_36]|nr:MAG: cytochrome c, class I [Burkholderiales bacterium RIFCSPLOWO2_02_FULL_57_36]